MGDVMTFAEALRVARSGTSDRDAEALDVLGIEVPGLIRAAEEALAAMQKHAPFAEWSGGDVGRAKENLRAAIAAATGGDDA